MEKKYIKINEAMIAMKEGKKVRHRFFANDEWMMRTEDGKYLFEDGVKCSFLMFWMDRTGEEWNDDWSIVE